MAALNEPVCLPKVKTAVVSCHNGAGLSATEHREALGLPIVTLTLCVLKREVIKSPSLINTELNVNCETIQHIHEVSLANEKHLLSL